MSERTKPDSKKIIQLLLTLILPAIILLVRPLGMDLRQSGVLAAFLLTILWWVTGVVERTIASVFLLAVFLVFSVAPAKTVFSFPISENFLMIACSFLFSQGIGNSGLADKLLGPVLDRFGRTVPRLLALMICSGAVMIFVIPQPFSRIIILALIYSSYFDRIGLDKQLKSVLMFALYLFTVLLNLTMVRSDIILSNTLMAMAETEVPEQTWIAYMTVPTLAYLALSAVLFSLVFRKTLKYYPKREAGAAEKPVALRLSGEEKRNLAFVGAIVALWATEELHGVSGTIIILAATALMFPLGMLRWEDRKALDVKLLVFLTAAFSIGGSLKACGVADVVFSVFAGIFPGEFSWTYIMLAAVTSMLVHMVLGSDITTMSVVVPGLMTIGAGVAPALPLLFLIYTTVCSHFLLPFHHVVIMIGNGKGYYSMKELVRYGAPHTALMLFSLFALYLPWWKLLGFL